MWWKKNHQEADNPIYSLFIPLGVSCEGRLLFLRDQLKMNTPDLFSPASYKDRLLVLGDQLKMNTSDLFSRDSETLAWENIKKFPSRLFSSSEYDLWIWPLPLHKMFILSVHLPTNIFKMSAIFLRKCLKLILPTEQALLVTQVLWTCAKVNYREVPILISVSMDTVHLSQLEVSLPEIELQRCCRHMWPFWQ